MRRLALTCVLLSTSAPLGCFEDLGPLPGLDDDVDGSSSGSESGSSESSAEADVDTDSSTTAESTTDTEGGIEGIYEPCGEQSSCPGGGECSVYEDGWYVFNVCLPIGCDVSILCPPPSEEYGSSSSCNAEHQCVLDCETNEQCGQGLVCSDSHCYFNSFWGPCTGDEDCPPGNSCASDGAASACLPSCTSPSDCPTINVQNVASAVCVNDGCEIPCVLDAECPAPMKCQAPYCRYPGVMP